MARGLCLPFMEGGYRMYGWGRTGHEVLGPWVKFFAQENAQVNFFCFHVSRLKRKFSYDFSGMRTVTEYSPPSPLMGTHSSPRGSPFSSALISMRLESRTTEIL